MDERNYVALERHLTVLIERRHYRRPKGQVDLISLHEGLVIEALLKHAGQQNLQIFRVHSFVLF